ncbi:MAG: hypothetical protein WCK81_01340 [Betaproteobacteria bacterium]
MKTSTQLKLTALVIALGTALGGCSVMGSKADTDQAAAFDVAVIGDVPYGTSPTDTRQMVLHPRFISAINADADVSFVAHIGDIHAGKQYCTQEYNKTVFDHWAAFKKPLVYTPGDNEWMDCHKAKEGGGSFNKTTGKIDYVVDAAGQFVDYAKGDPIANLELVRSMFFAKPGLSLGAPMAVHSQAVEFNPAHPADKAFVENVWWEKSGVLFVTLNIPGGSNNGQDPWYGVPTMTPEQQKEVADRSAATLRWIDAAYNRATTKGNIAMVIFTQADMWDVDESPAGVAHLSGYKQYLDKIAEGTKAYGMPVLMLMGDSHTYRSDIPLAKGAACAIEVESGKPAVACSDSRAEALIISRKSPVDAYMAQNHGYNVPNFHRIVVHGETMPLEWLKLHIDPMANAKHGLDAFGPFSWKRVPPAM